MIEPISQPPSNTPPLPRIYIDEKKRGVVTWVMIIFLSITMLSIPIGVYLVGQRTNILPKAASDPASEISESINLETDNNNLSDGVVFPVRINIKSDIDEANLFAAVLKYKAQNLEIVRIATDSGLIVKWVELNFDNQAGLAKLTGAVPNPGLKTVTSQTYTMATIFFRAKGSAKTDIVLETAKIFRNSDNQNIIKNKKDLNLTIGYSSASTPPPVQIQKPDLLVTDSGIITSPLGGEVYSFYKTMPISWSPINLVEVQSLNIFLNGKFYTSLGKNLENTGRVLWQPSQTLLLPLISNQNTFQFEIQAIDKSGSRLSSLSGPFALTASTDFVPVSSPSAVIPKGETQLDFISKLFTNYNLVPLKNKEVDLNSDSYVNELDLFLLRKLLNNL